MVETHTARRFSRVLTMATLPIDKGYFNQYLAVAPE